MIQEPTEFGSIIRATYGGQSRRLFQMAPTIGKHYWEDEDGWVEVWSALEDVEIVRVGLGDMTAEQLDHLRAAGGQVGLTFCSRTRYCRLTDGHNGGCQP